METDTVVTFPSGLSMWTVRWIVTLTVGSPWLAAVAGIDRFRGASWHFRGESANKDESR